MSTRSRCREAEAESSTAGATRSSSRRRSADPLDRRHLPTSTSAPSASFHPEIELGREQTRVLCEMVGAVDARNLGAQAGHLSHDELRAVDDALSLVLDIG